jgi:hypothetical protein
VTDGRRIYIHQRSFGEAAAASERWGYQASLALSAVRTAKIAHHHIVENGVTIGAVRAEVAQMLVAPIAESRSSLVGGLLRKTGHRPNIPYRQERLLPVLFPGEEIVNTCFQDDYFTFATSPDAAERMFADREPMRELRANIGAGRGPHDLTIISGKLTPLRHDVFDMPVLDKAGRVQIDDTPVEPLEIEMEPLVNDLDLRDSLVLMVRNHISRVGNRASLTPDEAAITTNFMSAQSRVLAKPNFYIP